ncbi:aminotransferase class I/II-fold pyridoxal phosphate-dependent enzyme [Alkalihalobacillus hemicellulosilyticus]|uniref:Arginine decarboxylase n=1 Tax=Halalkalibacter hemicellulosilyticusJCM 9152 TaxID=1236971 RepID=W4QK36_9BACI|nr:aminotransferase class I/II-fold pyridoxal phosphate-dependent enzyme [Halalkalibacter hemicellulosilyticus]GAE31719.1 arginine decarboxylase [Halalkalibacter hemicellulosilyticusJCM 9152]
MKQSMPLITAIQQHIEQQPLSLHVPGHKNGHVFSHALQGDFQSVLPYDVTELIGLDDLHDPTGPIALAQQKAAHFYQMSETHFLVGGSTAGNIAMVYGLFERGDTVLLQRNSHKSLFHACEIAGVTPILVTPEYDEHLGQGVGITAAIVRQALEQFPQIKGVILTYPNYFGVSMDIQEVIEEAKRRGLVVLVDEAHGVHFVISQQFPPSACELGADVVVQSAHKMLPALTMSSFLHISKHLPMEAAHRIKEALTMFQSSSPSYLLMASLDGAREFVERLTEGDIAEILAGIEAIKRELSTIQQIKVIESNNQSYHYDPLKVTIRSRTALSGYQLQDVMMECGMYVELATERDVLLVFGLAPLRLDTGVLDKLREKLSTYSVVNEKDSISLSSWASDVRFTEMKLGRVHKLQQTTIPLTEASGRMSLESIIPYPPGIPVLLRGEVIQQGTVDYIQQLADAGARFQGKKRVDEVLVVDSEEIE